MVGFIAYCPELDLFHYYVKDILDEKFSSEQAELTIAAHLGEGREKEADFMASLVTLAKASPHKKISITDEAPSEDNGEAKDT
jgi:hypothetical protein